MADDVDGVGKTDQLAFVGADDEYVEVHYILVCVYFFLFSFFLAFSTTSRKDKIYQWTSKLIHPKDQQEFRQT